MTGGPARSATDTCGIAACSSLARFDICVCACMCVRHRMCARACMCVCVCVCWVCVRVSERRPARAARLIALLPLGSSVCDLWHSPSHRCDMRHASLVARRRGLVLSRDRRWRQGERGGLVSSAAALSRSGGRQRESNRRKSKGEGAQVAVGPGGEPCQQGGARLHGLGVRLHLEVGLGAGGAHGGAHDGR